MAQEPVIALDAMGGDHAPREPVRGAVMAARRLGLRVALVGQPEAVAAELERLGPRPPTLELVPAAEVIAMDEEPARAAWRKRDSSIAVGLRLLKEGKAQAFVSAGNTGAIMAAAIMHLGRIRGIERPTLAALMPLGRPLTLLLDVGANADVKPHYLVQWAQMASAYLERAWKVDRPRVGLLNIGEEETKGNALAQEAYRLLKASGLNFIGNVEGKDITRGLADVVVTDGFTGNVVIKTMEGMVDLVKRLGREALLGRPYHVLALPLVLPAVPFLLLAGAVLAPSVRDLLRRTSWREYGAGPLLGVDGLVFVAHGRSDARAIYSSLRVAREAARSGMLAALREVASPVA
ncbi:MAG TPA: phosphate acyltransferase PlsX [Dehalococcoidia bacterium]|nr:phosphate acyltransferase PlsX [Dehalococcoidia bacterium]